ncbi:hypothetical protein DL765_000435 [Monosporascus sp. GIB2]|nr:hypothetical protein DL765_000435 [Monosporascus sp. GIB2]
MATNGTRISNGVSPSSRFNGLDDFDGSNRHHGNQASPLPPMPIAVVGMACRFAGDVTNPEKLWDLCASGRDAWSSIPEARFDVTSLYHANREKPGRNHATGGYFLQEDVALFDAAFFNFTADVASAMDPQLRLLLEVVYEATEDAGLPIEKLAGPGPNTSVFTGCYTKDYHDLQTRDPESMPPSTLTGNYTAMLSNRVSHFYDFQGASMSIDTGCSAALAALHQGCQAIRLGESNVSIIGASNVILNPDIYIAMSSLGMVGADGRCYAWDSRAQGYGRGEGVAVLILKSLDAALRDGDRVHAVIRHSGLNQDGKTTTITSPSMDAQIRLIRDCYRQAGLDLSETGYVEAHMTGTQAGDATEAESLARTFGMSRTIDDPIWVGSVKTSVGHTEGVSGLAGIIKTVMAMKYRSIAPNLNYAVGNAKIPLKDWHLQVPTSLTPWPHNKPLRASINNFGYGGTNAHVILETAPEQSIKMRNSHCSDSDNDDDDDISRLYILSTQDSATAKIMARNLAAHLRERTEDKAAPRPRDLAFTLTERRSRFSWVAAVRARSLMELTDRLEGPAIKVTYAPSRKQPPRLGFVFNGQGAQWHAMGRELLHTYPVFAAAMEEADVIMRGYGAEWSLREELMRDAKSARVSQIQLGQPITVALQICLVVLLRSWDIHPSAVTSHSSGEIAAAYAAGALSFKQALGVTYWRGELARVLLDRESSGIDGGMAAGGIGPDEAERYVTQTSSGGRVVVACVNSPQSVTFSGDVRDLDEVVARLEGDGVFARRLKVPLAYHSHHMLRMASAYLEKLRTIVPPKPTWSGRVAYTSPVTGGFITSPETLTPEHYVRNLTSPVLFSQAFESMCFGPDTTSPAQLDAIVEIGPHGTLAGPIRQILRGRKMAYGSCLTRHVDAVETMQDLAGELVHLGYPVSLAAVNHYASANRESKATAANFVPDLPSYPWNHTTRYWSESHINKDIRYKKFPPHELLGLPVSGATMPEWRNFLRLTDLPWVCDHRVDGAVVLPGAAYVSMAIEAVRLVTDPSEKDTCGYRVRDVDFLNALTISEPSSALDGGVETHLRLQPCRRDDLAGWYEFDVRSLGANDAWIDHCRGLVSAVMDPKDVDDAVMPDVESFLNAADSSKKGGAKVRHMDGAALRAHVAEMGIEYGPAFQGLTDGRASTANNLAVTNLLINSLESEDSEESRSASATRQPWTFTSYVIHPTTLDCIVQATYTNVPPGTGQTMMVLPRSIQAMYVPRSLNRKAGESLVVFSELCNSQYKGFTSNISVTNAEANGNDTVLLEIDRLYCQAIPRVIESGPEILLSKTHWEPDILHGIPASVKDSMRITLGDEEIDLEKKMVRASYYLISDAVAALEKQNSEGWTPHCRSLLDWMKTVVAQGKSGQLAPNSRVWARASTGVKQVLFDELKADDNTHGSLVVRVGQKLAEIVRGDTTPADLMKQGAEFDLGNQYYQKLPSLQTRSYKHLSKLAQLFAVKRPGAKVLEVSAGTGGATRVVLEALGHRGDGGSLVDKYTFTDVSSELFEAASRKLAPWADVLEFRELDIEKEDPTGSANLTAQSMDLVVASMVLCKARDPQKALTHIQELLKPDGKLLLVEPTQIRLDTQLVFGTLHGWEKEGKEPVRALKVEAWDELLRANGFTGVDFDIDDCEQLNYQCSKVILASAASPKENVPKGPSTRSFSVSIVVDLLSASTPSREQWITQLTQAILAKTGNAAVVESLDTVSPDKNKVYILATDVTGGRAALDSVDEPTFEKLRDVLVVSRGILWLTSGGVVDAPSPASAQVQGLLRTLRQEDASKAYTLLDLPQNWSEIPEIIVSHIVHVLQQTLQAHDLNLTDFDWEYAVRDSMLHVPRVYPIHNDNRDEPEPEILQPFQQPSRVLVWETSASGKANFVQEVHNAAKDVPDNVVEIETMALSLNHNHGTMLGGDDEISAAYEVAGVVTRLGRHTEASGLRVGDSVCGVAKGPFASTARAVWTSTAKIPEGLSLEDAACIPLAYAAAYHALVHTAKLQRGEKVLIIYAAGDPDAQATLKLASQMGANVFFAVTNGGEAESHAFVDKCHPSPRRILPTRGARGFAQTIMTETDGVGIDIIIGKSTSLSASLLQAASQSIRRFGRLVELGAPGMKRLDMAPMLASRCATHSHIDMLQLAEHNGRLMREALEASLRIIRQHPTSGHPVAPSMLFSISQVDKALHHVQQQREKGRLGKAVIIPRAGDLVNVVPHARPLSLGDTKSTYLIIGSVGGIGGAIASWMVSKGAKNVLVISRNARTHPDTTSLVHKAEEKGCDLQFLNCDVSNEESLVGLLNQVSASLPPIRGVVHAAAVLEDTVLERMTFSQWQLAVQPKVAGTKNLHKHLPNDLSFFILLSSITGVAGHLSQANYAAANTFEDALARHRVTAGLPAVSLDLPAITGSGMVAGDDDARRRVEALGTVSVPIDRVLGLVEAAIERRSEKANTPDNSQIIVGLLPWNRLPLDATIRRDRRFGTLRLARSESSSSFSAETSTTLNPTALLMQAIKRGTAMQEVKDKVAEALAARLANIFNVPVEGLDPSIAIAAHGVDSLVAVELRNWLASAIKAKLSIFEILQSPSLREFAGLVLERSTLTNRRGLVS